MIDESKLTERHRVVMKHEGAPREYEVGLWVGPGGVLLTDALDNIRDAGGTPGPDVDNIVRVIEPPFEPTPGMVVGDPDDDMACAVFLPSFDGGYRPWLGMVPDEEGLGYSPEHWFSTDTIRSLIEDRGWEVMS